MSTTDADVVVVGAGPVGLVAACELARHGVRVRIFDKLSTPTEESRAIALHARSLDMLDRMGVASGDGFFAHHRGLSAGGLAVDGLRAVEKTWPASARNSTRR